MEGRHDLWPDYKTISFCNNPNSKSLKILAIIQFAYKWTDNLPPTICARKSQLLHTDVRHSLAWQSQFIHRWRCSTFAEVEVFSSSTSTGNSPPCILVSTSGNRMFPSFTSVMFEVWTLSIISKQKFVFSWSHYPNELCYSFNSWASIASALSGPSLFTLGIMFSGDMNLTNSCSSVKLLCSL